AALPTPDYAALVLFHRLLCLGLLGHDSLFREDRERLLQEVWQRKLDHFPAELLDRAIGLARLVAHVDERAREELFGRARRDRCGIRPLGPRRGGCGLENRELVFQLEE